MRAVSAIFTKQLNDFPKNMSVALLYVMYPVLAIIFSTLMPVEGDGVGSEFFTMTFAMMFVASTPMITMANTIAEDNEYKSLRFLVMAGVRPHQYILGLGAFTVIMSLLPLAVFAVIGGFGLETLAVFVPVALLGCLASLVLGGVVGIFSKNVQQCAAIYTPLMMVIAFVPFVAIFNPAIGDFAQVLFSHQIFMLFAEAVQPGAMGDTNTAASMGIIAANLLVFAVLFVVAYKKKGLKG